MIDGGLEFVRDECLDGCLKLRIRLGERDLRFLFADLLLDLFLELNQLD